jgi:hypothetical protein
MLIPNVVSILQSKSVNTFVPEDDTLTNTNILWKSSETEKKFVELKKNLELKVFVTKEKCFDFVIICNTLKGIHSSLLQHTNFQNERLVIK